MIDETKLPRNPKILDLLILQYLSIQAFRARTDAGRISEYGGRKHRKQLKIGIEKPKQM